MQKRMLQPLSDSKITTIYNPSAVSSRRRTPKNKQKTYMEPTCLQYIKNWKMEKKTCTKSFHWGGAKRKKKNHEPTLKKWDVFEETSVIESGPQENICRKETYTEWVVQGWVCSFLENRVPPIAECNLRAPFCTCGVDAWLGIALNFGALHVSLPKNLCKLILGCSYSGLSMFLDAPGGSYSVDLTRDMCAGSLIL